jgi:hypothetical protein
VFRLGARKRGEKLNLSQLDFPPFFHHLSKASSVFMSGSHHNVSLFSHGAYVITFILMGKKRYINVALKFMLQCRRKEREAAVNSAEDRVENFFPFTGKLSSFPKLHYENYINLI